MVAAVAVVGGADDVEAAAVILDVDVEDVAGTRVVEVAMEAALLMAGAAAGVAGVAGDEEWKGEEGLAAGGHSSEENKPQSRVASATSAGVDCGLARATSIRARRPERMADMAGAKGGSKGRRGSTAASSAIS